METGFRYCTPLIATHAARDGDKLVRAQHVEDPSDVRVGQVAFRFLAGEQQVHQVVIAQLQQARQRAYVRITEVMLISAEKTLEDQIVFQQAAPRAPT